MGKGLNPEIYEDDTDPDCRPVFRRSTTDCACMIPRMKDKSSVSRGASLPSTLRWAHPDIVYIDFLSLFGTMNGVIYTANILGDPSIAGDWSSRCSMRNVTGPKLVCHRLAGMGFRLTERRIRKTICADQLRTSTKECQ